MESEGDLKPQLNRRELLRGKLGVLLGPDKKPPLVARYPQTAADLDTAPGGHDADPTEVKNIAGISIEPVATTDLRRSSAATPLPVFRPPGAVEEQQFLAGCTRCNDCADACPQQAIRPLPERFGSIAGTPTIIAESSACLVCEDFPCVTACPTGVLDLRVPTLMGTAKITEHLCLAHHGTFCSVCRERCPVPGAIEVSAGKPSVDEQACVGCGVCRYVCPAPENAILLMPALHRPRKPRT